MSGGDRPRLSLEERLELAARSRASSPEAAVRLVQRLSRLGTENLFCNRANLNAMYELIGEAMDDPDMGVDYYSGFCRCVQLAILWADGMPRQPAPDSELDPYRPLWGARVNNAIVLLGLMLLAHVKNRMKRKDIYHCTRMTLEQYLDALEKLGACQVWADELRQTEGSRPLGDVLEDILARYLEARQVFGHLDHILRCMGGLACYLEQKEGQAWRFRELLCRYDPDLEGRELLGTDARYPDPSGYFFALANEYPGGLPDLGGGIPLGTVRSRIFLPERNYRPDVLHGLASLSPSPELRKLLERNITEERLARAMRELNQAVVGLYWLWVAPYLRF